MKFIRLLTTLIRKGRISDAEHYETIVTERFQGMLSKRQFLDLDVDQIVAILNVAKIVKDSQLKQPSPLQNYIMDLQARGFSVSLGEKYRE